MKSRKESAHEVSRRDFAFSAALAATAAVLPAPALSQAATQSPELPKEVAAEVDSKHAEILRLYGSRLSQEQKDEIRRQLVSLVPGLQKLRAYDLKNGDAPATVLKLNPERI